MRAQQAGRRARNRIETFLADESAQAQLVRQKQRSKSKSRSRSESKESAEPATGSESPDFGPMVFRPEVGRQRLKPIEPELSGRRARGAGDRAKFRGKIQQRRQRRSQVPKKDLRQATEFSNPSQAQAQAGSNVVPRAVNRLETAQEPQVRVDDTLNPTAEDLRAPAAKSKLKSQQKTQLQVKQKQELDVQQRLDVLEEAATQQDVLEVSPGQSREVRVGSKPVLDSRIRNDATEIAGAATQTDVIDPTRTDAVEVGRQRQRSQTSEKTTPVPTPPPPNRGGRGRRTFSLPFGDFPQGGQRDFSPGDRAALFDNEFTNPVAAPDELDDVAADVLGRDEEDRRDPMDGLADLPGGTENDDDNKDGFNPLEEF